MRNRPPSPVTQKGLGEESVDLFGSTDEMKAYLKARVEACNYAESVTTTAGGVLKFGFKGAPRRGAFGKRRFLFTVNGGGYWAADGVATPVKADAEALRGGASPAVTLTAGGTIAFDGPTRARPLLRTEPLRCAACSTRGNTFCFVFADGEVIRIGSELNGFVQPAAAGGKGNLKILFIGNSFTVDATEHLPGMLKSAGITHVRMVRAYHGGYKLPEFFENYAAPDICTYYYCEPGATKWENEGTLNRSLKSIVESDTWDIVTLQEHTGSYYAWEWDETERARFPDFVTTSSRRSPRPAHDRATSWPRPTEPTTPIIRSISPTSRRCSRRSWPRCGRSPPRPASTS